MNFQMLIEAIEKSLNALDYLKNFGSNNFDIKYEHVLKDSRVRELIEWEKPKITNLSDLLELSNGKIEAVRLDLLKNKVGLKKPVVGSLIVRHLLSRIRTKKVPKGIIDGGNFNTGIALAYYAKKFNSIGALVHTRYFPDYFRNILSNSNFGMLELLEAPSMDKGIEREFYSYLVSVVRNNEKYRKFLPLWHAKYGGKALLPLGKIISDDVGFYPDYIVLSLGSGSNLEGIVSPIHQKFNRKPKIVIVEHVLSPLLNRKEVKGLEFKFLSNDSFSNDWLTPPPNGIPHMIVGPHYHEINPLLSRDVLNIVDYVYRVSDKQWQWMASFCKARGLSVGNSSAANLVVSRALAEKGYSVLTIIVEPLRTIYEKSKLTPYRD